MMRDVAGFRAWPLEIDRKLKLVDPTQVDDVIRDLATQNTTDLFVIAHGWRNDEKDARRLYAGVFTNLRAEMNRDPAALNPNRRYMILEIYWPSKKSADSENIPGGAASVDDATKGLVGDFAELFGDAEHAKIERLEHLAPKIEQSAPAQQEFLKILRELVGPSHQQDTDAADRFHNMSAADFFDKMGRPALSGETPVAGGGGATAMPDTGGAGTGPDAGGAVFLGGLLKGVVAKVKDSLDIATYYTMKERAGQIGQGPVNEVLRKIRDGAPGLRLHLIGHSFGGRLVTAAVLGPSGTPPLKVSTLTLLQAAFSHYGLSGDYKDEAGQQKGFFRPIIERNQIAGPILITHSKNDKAVGMAYPLASRLAGQEAADVGDEKSLYGGMGRNGAQKTERTEKLQLQTVDTKYVFKAGGIYNLRGDGKPGHPGVIGSHSDIEKPEIAHAMVAALAV